MSFPKKVKFFPKENGNNEEIGNRTNGYFVEEIASALKRSLGDSRAGVKTVAEWTGPKLVFERPACPFTSPSPKSRRIRKWSSFQMLARNGLRRS